VFALAGRRVAERVKAFRAHQRGIRAAGGALMLALALALAFNVTDALQRALPGYTESLQSRVAENETVQQQLDLGGLVTAENEGLARCTNNAPELEDCGPAPEIRGIETWLNSDPVTLESLRGRVVLIDFWAYSCINCQRSIPHVTAWDEAYRDAGLRVIGVHSPEYAFEKEAGNVESAAEGFGMRYPVALDNNLGTWTNYRNRYWPAHYIVEAQGTVRHIKFGEGDYDVTEKLIRELLRDADAGVELPAPTDTTDETPDVAKITRETFLGSTKRVNYAGDGRYTAGERSFSFPGKQAKDSFTLDGDWTLTSQNITPTAGEARIRLDYRAKEVRMVLSGTGTVTYTAGGREQTIQVEGTPNSYRLIATGEIAADEVTLTVSPGVRAYSFTFG
jgi:thiol-disulfide isomerase/thioredoxin